jgi:hypothetical protein
VNGTFEWADVAVQDQVDLRHAQTAQLDDEFRNDEFPSWPDASVWLDGFQYGALGQNASRWTVKQRCQWLASLAKEPEGYVPSQPYQQLLQVLRASGRDAEAREIAIAGQRRLRAGHAAVPSRIWNWFLYWTIAYGYKPWRALVPSLALVIIGGIVFCSADLQGQMAPSMAWAYQDQSPSTKPVTVLNLGASSETPTKPTHVRREYPRFVAPVYSLDAFLPIVDLRQKNYWIPKPTTTFGWVALGYLWFQILSGWILTTTLVAALSGLIKKE